MSNAALQPDLRKRGNAMLDRLSVNGLLKSVIAALSVVVVVLLAAGAWSSWSRLQVVSRIAGVAAASTHLFTALHNLRSDRTRSFRLLSNDQPMTTRDPNITQPREAEMPALKAALSILESVDFPDRQAVVAELAQRIKRLTALHEEWDAAMRQPKAARRAGLAPEIRDEITAFITMLDNLSQRLNRVIQLGDPFIDQLMEVKQLAWVTRDAGGDANVLVSDPLNKQPLPADPLMKYGAYMGKHENAWATLEQKVSGLQLPGTLTNAIAIANQGFFAPDFKASRLNILKKVIAGEAPGVTADQWSAISLPKLALLLKVAEAALDVAKDYAAQQQSAAMWKLLVQLAMLAAATAFAVGLMLLVSRRVIMPLQGIQGAMLKLAEGDFGVAVPGVERKDEVGAIANAVERFKAVADQKARQEAEVATQRQQAEAAVQAKANEERARTAEERARTAEQQAHAFQALANGLKQLATGDLTVRVTDELTDDYKQIKEDFNATVAQLQETISAIAAATREVTNASAEISTSSTDLSQRTEEQAASLEETSASMEEISATVKKNAENAHQANQSSANAREVANRGGEVVAKAVEAMGQIESSSRKISDIIGVIDEIARQTNLLALNAAVEAARAGEAGRGFAVVASEVRNLAQRSSQAAKDIKDLITSSGSQVQNGVELVNKAGGALAEIVESINKVATIVSDIAAASSEQASGVEEVNKALTQMDEVTQQNSALVEQATATSKTLDQQAQAMSQQVAFFRLEEGQSVQAKVERAAVPIRQPTVESVKRRPAAKQGAAKPAVAGGGRQSFAKAVGAEADWREF
jgi:methyl-accepting chemotaxis protein